MEFPWHDNQAAHYLSVFYLWYGNTSPLDIFPRPFLFLHCRIVKVSLLSCPRNLFWKSASCLHCPTKKKKKHCVQPCVYVELPVCQWKHSFNIQTQQKFHGVLRESEFICPQFHFWDFNLPHRTRNSFLCCCCQSGLNGPPKSCAFKQLHLEFALKQMTVQVFALTAAVFHFDFLRKWQ